MLAAQILINALVLGCLYACIAIGFSLVWGVLNVINLIHGSFIVLGAYLAWGLYQSLHISPWYALLIAAPAFFALGYILQRLILNRVITAPVLVTLTLTFGLEGIEIPADAAPGLPSDYSLVLQVLMGQALMLQLVVTAGADDLTFEEGLHTYFAVGDINQVRVEGLELDTREEELKPVIDQSLLTDLLEPMVVLGSVRLEVPGDVQQRMLQSSGLRQHQVDQKAPDSAVSVQERMDGLELVVHETTPNEDGQLTRRVDEILPVTQRIGEHVRQRRHEDGSVWIVVGSADPDGGPP